MCTEMATGIGKTEMMAILIEHLLASRQAERILFLVDRDQLARWAVDKFSQRRPDFVARIPHEGEIFVATIQTLATADKAGRPFYENCEKSFFELVVSDECHRSIYGDWRPILDHFDAIQIGLTATPAVFEARRLKFNRLPAAPWREVRVQLVSERGGVIGFGGWTASAHGSRESWVERDQQIARDVRTGNRYAVLVAEAIVELTCTPHHLGLLPDGSDALADLPIGTEAPHL